MTRHALPTHDQVAALPALVTRTVTEDFIDENGHMNIRHYMNAGALGADQLLRSVGVEDTYRAERRLGVFTAEHHIRYFSEMRLGDEFSAHTLFLARSERAGHLLSFVLDRTHSRLACTVEITVVHVGLDTRRPVPFPPDIAAGIDAHVAQAAAITWPVPLSGSMGIGRSA